MPGSLSLPPQRPASLSPALIRTSAVSDRGAAAKKAAGERATTHGAPSGWWPPPVRDSERPRDDTPGFIMAVQQLLAGE